VDVLLRTIVEALVRVSSKYGLNERGLSRWRYRGHSYAARRSRIPSAV